MCDDGLGNVQSKELTSKLGFKVSDLKHAPLHYILSEGMRDRAFAAVFLGPN